MEARRHGGGCAKRGCYFKSICSCYFSCLLRLPGNSKANVGLDSLSFFFLSFFVRLGGFLQLQLIVLRWWRKERPVQPYKVKWLNTNILQGSQITDPGIQGSELSRHVSLESRLSTAVFMERLISESHPLGPTQSCNTTSHPCPQPKSHPRRERERER